MTNVERTVWINHLVLSPGPAFSERLWARLARQGFDAKRPTWYQCDLLQLTRVRFVQTPDDAEPLPTDEIMASPTGRCTLGRPHRLDGTLLCPLCGIHGPSFERAREKYAHLRILHRRVVVVQQELPGADIDGDIPAWWDNVQSGAEALAAERLFLLREEVLAKAESAYGQSHDHVDRDMRTRPAYEELEALDAQDEISPSAPSDV